MTFPRQAGSVRLRGPRTCLLPRASTTTDAGARSDAPPRVRRALIACVVVAPHRELPASLSGLSLLFLGPIPSRSRDLLLLSGVRAARRPAPRTDARGRSSPVQRPHRSSHTIALCIMVGGILVVSEVPPPLALAGSPRARPRRCCDVSNGAPLIDPWQDPQVASSVQAIIWRHHGVRERQFDLPTDMIVSWVRNFGIGLTVVIAAFAWRACPDRPAAIRCQSARPTGITTSRAARLWSTSVLGIAR